MIILRLLSVFLFVSVSCSASWISSSRVGDTAYFVFAYPARIERYDLNAKKWMPALRLPSNRGLPTAGMVDADGIYIARGKSAWRYSLSGTDEVHFLDTTDPILEFLSDGNLLFVNHSGYYSGLITSYDKSRKQKIDSTNYFAKSFAGSSIAPSVNRIFGRSKHVYPSDITYVAYTDAGQFIAEGESPHHGEYPEATKTWVLPDEKFVVDSSGTLYDSKLIRYAGSLGLAFDHLQFIGGVPVAASGTKLTGFTDNLLPLTSATLPFKADAFYVAGNEAVVFGADQSRQNGIRIHSAPLDSLKVPQTVAAADPNGLRYTPDNMFVDNEGILHLFSKSTGNIFRWDPSNFRYLDSIPLLGKAQLVAYSSGTHCVYTAYPSGLICSIALDTGNITERPFTATPHPPVGLAVADPFILAVEQPNNWHTHRLFDINGDQVGFRNLNYNSKEFVWSPANQKMYYLSHYNSPSYLNSEEINASGTAYPGISVGGIGRLNESSTGSFYHPLRVSPDGSVAVDGSGRFFDANTLKELPTRLTEAELFADILWQDTEIKTSRSVRDDIQVETRSSSTLQQLLSRTFSGKALRLFPLKDQKLLSVGVSVDGSLSFTVLDDSLNEVLPPALASPAGLHVKSQAAARLSLLWTDVPGENGYLVERKPSGSSTWTPIGITGTNITRLDLPTVASHHTFDYRVAAVRGALRSAPSPSLENVISGPPVAPAGFTASAVGGVITLKWKDVSFETGYRAELRLPSGKWMEIGRPEANSESMSAVGFEANTLYHFRIKASGSLGESPWKSTSVRTPPPVPEIVVIDSRKTELIDGRSTLHFDNSPDMNGLVRKKITIANVGTDDLIVHQVRVSGANANEFHIGKLPKITLGKRQAASFVITFRQRGTGLRAATLQIYSNDPNEKPFDVKLVGRRLSN